MENGYVKIEIENNIGTILFYHPKSNSLPSNLLRQLKEKFEQVSNDDQVNVVLLKSEGDKAFCAGASFDELLNINDFDEGKEFFMGFARLINSMRKCRKVIIGRIHNKAVGGGVGLVSACDYAFASNQASLKLSELALGLGPFVVGPPIERKIGKEAFVEMSLDCEWRSAEWGKDHGFYNKTFVNQEDLDNHLSEFISQLSRKSSEALTELKNIFWEGTHHWDKLLEERAEKSGKLVMSEFTKNYIEEFKSRKSD